MRAVEFTVEAFDEFNKYILEDKKLALKISAMLKETTKNPISGTGKPEPLKHQFKGYWS